MNSKPDKAYCNPPHNKIGKHVKNNNETAEKLNPVQLKHINELEIYNKKSDKDEKKDKDKYNPYPGIDPCCIDKNGGPCKQGKGFKYKRLNDESEEVEVDIVVVGSGPGAMGWPLMIRENAELSGLVVQRGDDLSGEPEVASLLRNRQNQSQPFRVKFYVDKGDSLPNEAAGGRVFRNSNEMSMVGGAGSGNNGNHIWTSVGVLEAIRDEYAPEFDPEKFNLGLKNMETYIGNTDPRNPDARGRHGPFKVTQVPVAGPNSSSLLAVETWKETVPSLPILVDPNNPISATGFTPQYQIAGYVPIDDPTNPGVRSSPATTAFGPDKFTTEYDENYFRQDLKNPNLRLTINTLGTRVVFENKPNRPPKAIGVECIRSINGQRRALFVHARKLVVLASGMTSPAILQRSGIGDPELLNKHNIPVIVNNPQVGRNIAYGILANVNFSKAPGAQNNFTDSVNAGFTNVNGATFPEPPFTNPNINRRTILTTTQDALVGETIVPSNTTARQGQFLVNTKSRGITQIISADPNIIEITDWQLFEGAGQQDIEVLADFIIQRVGPWLARLREKTGGVWGNVSAPPAAAFNDRALMLDWVRANSGPTCHITGGCRMGPSDPNDPRRGVVDSYGYVHGVSNLLVSDCSIAPVQADCNSAPLGYGMGIWTAGRFAKKNNLKYSLAN